MTVQTERTSSATNRINTVRKRAALTPRKEPYWHSIRRGAFVGLYVGASKKEWTARAIGPDGKYHSTSLGSLDSLDYDEAAAKALAFADLTARVERPNYTVGDAIDDYVADARTRNGEKSAKGIEQRLTLHVPQELRKKRLADLRTHHLKRWRDGLVRASDDPEDVRRSRDGANRILAILKAALNLAFRNGYAMSDGEWRRVPAFRDVDSARTLFLEPEEVQALLDAAQGGFRDLLEAGLLTGARYGELIALSRKDFDATAGTLFLSGKTGPRTSHLSSKAVEFFKRMAKGKLPEAPLLMRDDGQRWEKSHQHRRLKATIQAANAKGEGQGAKVPAETVFYSLRHYHISRALIAGLPVQFVAENCGTSVRMIEKHYGKFTSQDRQKMIDRVAL